MLLSHASWGRVALAVLVFVGSGASQRSAASELDLTIDAPIFEKICDLVALDEDQRVLASDIFDRYRKAIHVLDLDLHRRVNDAGWNKVVELSKSHRGRETEATWAEIGIHMRSSQNERARGLREADLLLERFYDDLKVLLMDGQLGLFPRVPLLVRRERGLFRGPTTVWGDFNAPINLRELFADAMSPDAEFAVLNLDVDDPPEELQQEFSDLRNFIESRMETWETELDSALRRTFEARRKIVQRGDHAVTAPVDRIVRSWVGRFDPLRRAVASIGLEASEVLGREAKDAWAYRWRSSLCPELHAERLPDVIHAWITHDDEGFEPWQHEAAQLYYKDYVTKRASRRMSAFQSGLAVKREHVSIVGSDRDQVRYAEKILGLRSLIDDYVVRISGTLSAIQKQELEEKLVAAQRYNPGLLGPPVYVQMEGESFR